MQPKIAIVCDWLVSRGGAERVIHVISEMFPEAPIYTSLYNKGLFPEFSGRNIVTSKLQKLPLALTRHHLYLPLMPYAFEQFDLSSFDIVISSAHSCAKGIITKPETLHICYCHSPTRYLWDNCHTYFEQFRLPRLLKRHARGILHELRIWDRAAADRVDYYIANSKHVSSRIWKYYRRESTVIYPPIDTETFKPMVSDGALEQESYFLGVGRLTPYKRFDLIADVCNSLKRPLLIVGKGRDARLLRGKQSKYVRFIEEASDQKLAALYNGCIALFFPHEEDLGMIPLEAMSCGKPVIAYAKGGALETVVPGKTGVLFEDQTPEEIEKAIGDFEKINWDAQKIREHAKKFSRHVFESQFRDFINEKRALHKMQLQN